MNILLDMDGVLCDFVGGVGKLFGAPPGNDWCTQWDIPALLGMSETEWWNTIDCEVGFWRNLQTYPWADELMDLCRQYGRVTVCTSPAADPQSLAEKLIWLNYHFGHGRPFREYMMGPAKHLMARPGSVLIDDNDQNALQFSTYGGQAVLFPRPWNTMRGHDPMGRVASELRRICDRK